VRAVTDMLTCGGQGTARPTNNSGFKAVVCDSGIVEIFHPVALKLAVVNHTFGLAFTHRQRTGRQELDLWFDEDFRA